MDDDGQEISVISCVAHLFPLGFTEYSVKDAKGQEMKTKPEHLTHSTDPSLQM